MRKIILTLIMLFTATSCIEREFNELKEIPKTDEEHIVYSILGRKEFAYHFNYQRGHNSVSIKVPKDIGFIMLDGAYQTVDYFHFLKFNNWFKKLIFENGIMPINQNQTLDCDNFAMLYKSLWSVAAYSSGNNFEFAVGLVVVSQNHPYGGVPQGGLHMLNIVFANKNYYIFEPQTGEFIELHKYPNQEYIKYIII